MPDTCDHTHILIVKLGYRLDERLIKAHQVTRKITVISRNDKSAECIFFKHLLRLTVKLVCIDWLIYKKVILLQYPRKLLLLVRAFKAVECVNEILYSVSVIGNVIVILCFGRLGDPMAAIAFG